MCTGFLADQIEQEFGDGSRWGVTIEYSREAEALGTAGAIKLAEPYLANISELLVMNGDSFLELDFQKLIGFHREHGGKASIAVRRVPDAARYGTVHLQNNNRVVRFSEKTGDHGSGLINGGVYAFNRAVLDVIPERPASLEKDILPGLIEQGVFALEQHGMFIDIGTPEDYARAQALREKLTRAAGVETYVRSTE
jgi:NDP-sugar pyrophosphorylase family protein